MVITTEEMKKKHFGWIVMLVLIMGFSAGCFMVGYGAQKYMDQYPIISCIVNGDEGMNIDGNSLPFTKESQREAMQWACARANIDPGITDYDDIFVMED